MMHTHGHTVTCWSKQFPVTDKLWLGGGGKRASHLEVGALQRCVALIEISHKQRATGSELYLRLWFVGPGAL